MIILICGTSSAGKTSVSTVLQQQLGEGWLRFSMDEYLGMLGTAFSEGLRLSNPDLCQKNNIAYAKQHEDGSYEIVAGKECSKLSATIPDVISTIAAKPFNIILDIVITSKEELNHYHQVLKRYGLFSVYLDISEAEVAKREKERENRLPGSAVHWLKKFNFKDKCDLMIDTTQLDVNSVVKKIKFELSNPSYE